MKPQKNNGLNVYQLHISWSKQINKSGNWLRSFLKFNYNKPEAMHMSPYKLIIIIVIIIIIIVLLLLL